MKYKHTKKQWIKWYKQKNDLLDKTYTHVVPLEFYRSLFPIDSLQVSINDGSDKGNAMIDIIRYYDDDKRYSKKFIMNDDLDALKYMYPTDKSKEQSRFCLCSPVSYYGKHKSNNMAHHLFAITLDIDYVGMQQLKNMIKQIGNGARLIPPNFIVNSGKGMHLYYLLEEPIPCYKYMIDQLTNLKRVMQNFSWNETTSLQPDMPDHGAITQAFRMVGSETKLGKEYRVEAFKVRDEKWTVEQIYAWIHARASSFLKNCPLPTLREPIEVYRQRHPLTLEQAKEKYPDWDPSNKQKRWICKRDLYDWWINQIKDKAVVGGRYYSILALSAYGSKCDIPYEQIKKDALELVPFLEGLTDDETNHFTEQDVLDALTFYRNNKKEVTYKLTRKRIQELSKIYINKNKRNYRKQEQHLAGARAIQEINDKFNGTNWRDGNGRKPKKDIVKQWRADHPNGKKADCIGDTGLTKPTVYKWW